MASVIYTNLLSLNAQRNLSTSGNQLAVAMQRLSSGLRINSAKDDAAGLAISERMSTQVRGLDQAARNASDGISFSQTAEGALSTTTEMLQRIRELAVQSSNSSNSATDRLALQQEVTQLLNEMDRIAQQANFNGQNLLDGSSAAQIFQVGANANQIISLAGANMRTSNYGGNRIVGATNAPATWGAAPTNPFTTAGLTISGFLGSTTVAPAANSNARDIANAVNLASATTGVSATATTEGLMMFTSAAAASYTYSIKSNNTTAVSVTFTVGTGAKSQTALADAIAQINRASGATGVTAEYSTLGGGSIKLTNLSGANIDISNSVSVTNSAATFASIKPAAGTAAVTIGASITSNTTGGSGTLLTGRVTLDSQASFAVSGNTTVATGTVTANYVSNLDVTTFDNAQLAIATIDAALATVSGQRAIFGAMQQRMEKAVAYSQLASENTSASRSRVRDADFAAETATLTRSQILQQAGTAMVAQANQMPQMVLSLLKA